MHGEVCEKADEGEGEEGVPGFFTVCGDGAVVAAEIACWDAVDFELKLQGDGRSAWRRYESADENAYFVYDSFPAPMHVCRAMSPISSQ